MTAMAFLYFRDRVDVRSSRGRTWRPARRDEYRRAGCIGDHQHRNRSPGISRKYARRDCGGKSRHYQRARTGGHRTFGGFTADSREGRALACCVLRQMDLIDIRISGRSSWAVIRLENIAVAIRAAECLGVDRADIVRGVNTATWPGPSRANRTIPSRWCAQRSPQRRLLPLFLANFTRTESGSSSGQWRTSNSKK